MNLVSQGVVLPVAFALKMRAVQAAFQINVQARSGVKTENAQCK